MTTYSTTWDADAANYRSATARALNKVEANAALVLTQARNCAWTVLGPASRTIGGTYTNTSGKPRFVAIYITYTATAGSGSATAKALCEFKETTDAAFVNAGNPALVGPTLGVSRTQGFFFMVGPSGQYRVTDQSSSSGVGASSSLTLLTWYEFDLTGVHTAQTWTTGEQVSALTKPNNYASDVSSILDKDAAHTASSGGTAATTITTATAFTMNTIRAGAALTVDQRDSGGSFIKAGDAGAAGTGGARTITVFVNNGGATRINTAAALFNLIFGPPLVNGTPITFTAGESGAATAQKWIDLDSQAAMGINVSEAWARTSGSGGGTLTTPTRMVLCIAAATLNPTTSASANVAITVNGNNLATAIEPNTLTNGGVSMQAIVCCLLSPGQSFAISSANATGIAYVLWTVPA